MTPFDVNEDITLASTLPSSFYKDENLFEQLKEKLFSRCWQLVEIADGLQQTNEAFPFILLPGFLNEPLLLVRNKENELKCFSNVCTHRGNILVNHSGKYQKFVCNYHGRRFSIDGKFEAMPEFQEAKYFPRDCEDLHAVNSLEWHGHPFVSLNPSFDISKALNTINEFTGYLPLSQFRHAPEYSREYLVNAHWALYCDNYLEGFHIPFVHPDLNKSLDYKNYKTTLFEFGSLQTGYATEDTITFDLPANHPDAGKRIAAYYFWLFPNMMFNFYPWGLSINVVKPMSLRQCKVSFLTYIYDEKKFDTGAGALLDKVEREDEFVVESVQRGISSRFYDRGRFSPTREQGVHHFHKTLSSFLG